jgi:hypothetical protein
MWACAKGLACSEKTGRLFFFFFFFWARQPEEDMGIVTVSLVPRHAQAMQLLVSLWRRDDMFVLVP